MTQEPHHYARMIAHLPPTAAAPAELLERLALQFSARHGSRAREELVALIELLIDERNFEMAQLWTRVMHVSDRVARRHMRLL